MKCSYCYEEKQFISRAAMVVGDWHIGIDGICLECVPDWHASVRHEDPEINSSSRRLTQKARERRTIFAMTQGNDDD